ncbi:MAG: GNAT family N-acetyltransferase [Myxococcaceae bacterium]|nr:GNAT family N-acetyltransferase [Myxococcaceae bacterium]
MKAKRVVETTVEESGPAMGAQAESLLALCGASVRDGQVLIVQRAGVVLGVGVLRLAAPDAEIVALVTDPNYRHHGVGRLLVREMARRARVAGCARLRVRLRRSDDAPLAFFARLGFEDTHVAFDLPL